MHVWRVNRESGERFCCAGVDGDVIFKAECGEEAESIGGGVCEGGVAVDGGDAEEV